MRIYIATEVDSMEEYEGEIIKGVIDNLEDAKAAAVLEKFNPQERAGKVYALEINKVLSCPEEREQCVVWREKLIRRTGSYVLFNEETYLFAAYYTSEEGDFSPYIMQAILFKNEESALLFANDKALLGFKTFKYDDPCWNLSFKKA